jgi:hypothetical protein
MPFIGQQPLTGAYHKLDSITTSATATYNLQLNGGAYSPTSANHLLVSLNGVMQAPQDSFTVSGSTITFASALTSSDNIDFIMALGDVLNIGTPSDGTVNTNQLVNSAVTDAKIAGMSSSKLTGALPALDGSALTGLVIPSEDHVRATISGGGANHNTLTYQTMTVQAESNNFTVVNVNELKPSVAGDYFVTFNLGGSLASTGGYTPTSYIYKNAISWAYQNGIRNYSGGSNLDWPTVTSIVPMNGTTDVLKFAVYQNSGANVTGTYGTIVCHRLSD